MRKLVYQDQAGSVLARSWDEVPRKGEVVSLISDRWGGVRRRFRVIEVDRFYSDVGGRGGGEMVFEPGEVMVHVVQLDDQP